MLIIPCGLLWFDLENLTFDLSGSPNHRFQRSTDSGYNSSTGNGFRTSKTKTGTGPEGNHVNRMSNTRPQYEVPAVRMTPPARQKLPVVSGTNSLPVGQKTSQRISQPTSGPASGWARISGSNRGIVRSTSEYKDDHPNERESYLNTAL